MSRWLGHSTITLTQSVYAHWLAERSRVELPAPFVCVLPNQRHAAHAGERATLPSASSAQAMQHHEAAQPCAQ